MLQKQNAIRVTIAVSLFLALAFSSCITQQKCIEKFPTKDSVINWVEYTCDSFPVYLPSDELLFDTTGIIPQSVVFHHSQKKGRLTSTVSIKNGKLTVLCAEDSLKQYIEYWKKSEHEKIIKNTTTLLECKEEHRDNIDYFYRWFTWIAVVLILIAVVIKCIRG